MNSKRKGKTGELDLAARLREHGFEARRGRQFKGTDESPDVIGIDGWHIECKRCEAGNLYKWYAQASREAGTKLPVVMHRRNDCQWMAILSLQDFLNLLQTKKLSTD